MDADDPLIGSDTTFDDLGATPSMGEAKRYCIVLVSDLLKVPAARRAACLAELPDWLAMAEALPGLLGDDIPILAQSFTWVDDGETGIRKIEITGEDGSGLTIERGATVPTEGRNDGK